MGDKLFDVPASFLPPPKPALSPDAARTARQKALLANGTHPATGVRVKIGEVVNNQTRGQIVVRCVHDTCGTCVHHQAITRTRATAVHKCELHRLGMSRSAASDIRVGWPACIRWEPET